jgi:hypothetical protein
MASYPTDKAQAPWQRRLPPTGAGPKRVVRWLPDHELVSLNSRFFVRMLMAV